MQAGDSGTETPHLLTYCVNLEASHAASSPEDRFNSTPMRKFLSLSTSSTSNCWAQGSGRPHSAREKPGREEMGTQEIQSDKIRSSHLVRKKPAFPPLVSGVHPLPLLQPNCRGGNASRANDAVRRPSREGASPLCLCAGRRPDWDVPQPLSRSALV
ncbi:uncharacterized protein B0I36DRAFT_313571 [Microdochium trichocladiopsis]|uniref:Uncharacterized protein n=1 Tax=Microdochium trichocladiopsis TaxID=1682393 RepID=A0A9P9BTQ8_9PEZI|nr:uncharacterized protein B0I36DRAFT_313571 [Microdochium trichocladiopsis]KAH7037227.1 hypothetical protein B0I36DRAFT_313571 [Microdochium trichocladiopsis]